MMAQRLQKEAFFMGGMNFPVLLPGRLEMNFQTENKNRLQARQLRQCYRRRCCQQPQSTTFSLVT